MAIAPRNAPIPVLVTATCGDVGQAVMKSLLMAGSRFVVHAADTNDGAATMFVPQGCFHRLPSARSEADYAPYTAAVDELCREHGIEAVIPASEAEIRALSVLPSHPLLPCGARIVGQPPHIIATHGDKLRSFQYLAPKVALADFCDGTDRATVDVFLAKHGFPLIVKERQSQGMRSVSVLQDRDGLELLLPRFDKPLLQTLLKGDDQEYSVGVFSHGDDIRLISFQRRLDGMGCSWYARLDQNAVVLDYARQIALAAGTQGSINVQLRLTPDGPRLLEINPRFSSLAAARAACGFNDVAWSVQQALGLPVDGCPPLPPHFEYQRYVADSERRSPAGPLEAPEAWLPLPKPPPLPRGIKLESERLVLRTLTPDDANDDYARWMNDPEVVRYTESRFAAHTIQNIRSFIESTQAAGDSVFLAIITRVDGRHIGNIKLGPINSRHLCADIGIILGEKDCWGHGHATEAIERIARHAFDDLHLHKLTAACYKCNVGSRRAFEKAGFVLDGCRCADCFCEGSWVDTLLLARWSKHPITP
jgi:RimJ/RimL family protein N-acetyltransferase